MQLVFEEGDLSVEQDWVLPSEFHYGDCMGVILWISGLPREL
jgi:hypothetical protein